MSSGIPYLGKGAKIAAKKGLLSPSDRHEKSKKTPDLTRGGNSNDIAHCSIIRDFTVNHLPRASTYLFRPEMLQLAQFTRRSLGN